MRIYTEQRFKSLSQAVAYDRCVLDKLTADRLDCIIFLVEWCKWFDFTIDGKRYWKFHFDFRDGICPNEFEVFQSKISNDFIMQTARDILLNEEANLL